MGRVDEKVAVVTGAARGIGRATALLLAREGARVAATDVVDDEGRSLIEEIRSADGVGQYWHLDVTDQDAVKGVFQEVRDSWGGVDVLVNNAGISGQNKPTDQYTLEEWQQVQDVNVKGVFLCTKEAVPMMRSRGGGSIINLSSIYGLVGAPDLPSYHASKGAVRLMSKTDALFYAKEGIRVNSVHPGYVWTPLVEDLGRRSPEGVDAFRQKLDSLHPIGHVGDPQDVANGILFLASEESRFMTGSELVLDGGYTAQ